MTICFTGRIRVTTQPVASRHCIVIHLHSHRLSLPRSSTPYSKLICFTNPFLHSLSGSIWTAFTDLGLKPELLYWALAFVWFSLSVHVKLLYIVSLYILLRSTCAITHSNSVDILSCSRPKSLLKYGGR